MSEINVTAKTRPPADASEWERAMALAADLARSRHIGERQAEVYAALELGVARDEICDRLDMSDSNSYQTYYDARDNVEDARLLVALLDDHPALEPPKTVEECPADEFHAARDSFAGDTRHAGDDSHVGEQFVDDDGTLVTVRQSLAEDEDGTAGYLLSRIRLESAEVGEWAVSADRLDELLSQNRLTPATATVAVEQEDI